MEANKRGDNTKTGRDTKASRPIRSLHAPKQPPIRGVIQPRRGHLSSDLSAKDSNHGSIQCSHARKETRLNEMGFVAYSNGRCFSSSSKFYFQTASKIDNISPVFSLFSGLKTTTERK